MDVLFLLLEANTLPNTVAPFRFSAFAETRKPGRFLESRALPPPLAALALLSTMAGQRAKTAPFPGNSGKRGYTFYRKPVIVLKNMQRK
ncbi:hypothetical protein [Dysosmobacter sp. Sow4_B12]|uniref:hypothetical protein n=1 Tax=Dysosmobacter sp. Sow4_B12 TaxID=3438777 RepID=UPI003F911E78